MITREFQAFRHAIACAALAATVSLYGSFAIAGEAPRRAVEYQTAELANVAGAQKLYNRLKTASREVCAQLRGNHGESTRAYQECYSKALANAVADVNQQTLTALHDRSDAKSARVNRAKADKSDS